MLQPYSFSGPTSWCVTSTVRSLALTEVTGAALAPPVRPSPAALVIRVADMDGVLAALTGRDGVEIFPEQVLQTQDGRVGREAGFLDPDGDLVVVFAITGRG